MSMFDLPTQVSELSGANSGMSNKRFVEVNCSRAVTDSTFANSLQEFKFNVSGTTWWIPRESFFRIRMAITRNDGTPIQLQDDIAPSYAVCDTLYRSLEFKMGGISVSRIGQYCPQISALKKRQEYSTQWRNELGQSIARGVEKYAPMVEKGLNIFSEVAPETAEKYGPGIKKALGTAVKLAPLLL